MKRYFAALMLLMPMLLTGCYNKWDYAGCPLEDNLELRFRLVDVNGGDVLAGKINKIDVVLFDENKNFVLHKPVNISELTPDHKIWLTVEPGTYYVVAWGNVGSNSIISTVKTRETTLSGSYVEAVSSETCSPLYYAPSDNERTRGLNSLSDESDYKVVLPQGKVVDKELNFVRAHRTINIYIQGLENISEYDGGQARVDMNNMPYKYDFFQVAYPERKDFSRRTETVYVENAGEMQWTEFSMPISTFEDDMTVYVRNGSDNIQLIDPIYLKTWVEKNKPEYLNEFDILISISKKGETVNVTVTLPNWDEIGVKPGDL